MRLNEGEKEMTLNGQAVLVKVHTVTDPQQIAKYLNSLSSDIVDVRVTAHAKTEYNPEYTIVAFVKNA